MFISLIHLQSYDACCNANLLRNVFQHNLVPFSGLYHSRRLQSLRIASNITRVITLLASRKESGDGAVISLPPDLQGHYPVALNLEINRSCSQPPNLGAELALPVTSLFFCQPASQHGRLERW
jgi:hypothetical protein